MKKSLLLKGKKSVYEGIESNFNCEIVFVTNKFSSEEDQFIKNLESRNFKVAILKSVDFNKISDTKTPQGIAAVFEIKKNKLDLLSLDDQLLVYLENISDPGNLGTIIRTCDWFGIQNIFLSKDIFGNI